MGASISKKKQLTVLLHGIDSEVKSKLYDVLQPGEILTTIKKTTGFNIEKIHVSFTDTLPMDTEGRDATRPIYEYFCRTADGCVFIIDSNDKERLDESIDELNNSMFQVEDARNKVIMVLANQQDKATALSVETIEERVREKICLNEPTVDGRSIFVKGCNIITNEGLCEAFSVFIELILLQKAGKLSPGYLKIDSTTEETVKSKLQAHIVKNGNHFHALKKLFDISFVKFKSALSQ